ncbi:ROK family protein [Chitinophaga sedimenti]|uniref:ROK family protein n=1 Tax=Chitinophaga sedimenti TaxID=2033606 RepID=UPI00200351E1|nr:ROK family protein [Chitinophaga sedimenti]MCK7554306.1 ROK family protein [Chitinophaga sedimenti]
MNQGNILAIDIGGSHIKASIIDPRGTVRQHYQAVKTPKKPEPGKVIEMIRELVKDFPTFGKVSVGFPGYVDKGVVMTAPNLGTDKWYGTPFRERLETLFGKPVQVLNDADLLGLGLIHGKGREMVVTLGTGFGTALFYNGALQPHLELGQHPFTSKHTYDRYIGAKALAREGAEKWNKRLKKVISVLQTVFNYDHLYISGGNAEEINFALDKNISVVSAKDGMRGGAKLWMTAEEEVVLQEL